MKAFIDNLLNRVTMYRMMLYYLIMLTAFAIVLGGVGLMPYDPGQIVWTVFFASICCYLFNWFFVILFHAKQNPESRWITALILALVIGPISGAQGALVLFVASFVAMGSKYVLAYERRHIFNPAAIGIITAAFFLGQGASWWIGNVYMIPMIVIGGLVIAYKIKRLMMVGVFVGVFITATALLAGVSWASFAVGWRTLINVPAFTPALFFAFVMLVEPLTSPQDNRLRYAYASFVATLGVGYGFFAGTAPYTLELALLSGNIFNRAFLFSPLITLHLRKREEVAKDVISFLFEPSRPVSFLPGQFMQWELPHRHADSRGTRRYFTISASPTEKLIALTTKFSEPSSTFKTALRRMREGNAMTAITVSGEFVLPADNDATPCVFIAGGIGITPFRSMIKYMLDTGSSRPITLLYSNKTTEDIAFKLLFDEAVEAGWLKAVYTITNAIPYGWHGRTGYITADMIKEEIPEYMKNIFYISGPQPMVSAFEKLLSEMGIPKQQVKTDYFPGYEE
ncbi:MAG: hypothetical protein UX70_C0001G0157 [Candidatus Wolfebacteria bacterium GW2011_GWB1_47_1]|uniref:FAD-binding FR-type domain-containing protein n=3 Tax=Candidatus Wolfeibacteriota TaxID=1752735 RepID=A0A0G4ARW0_9BACT|nr:MAG: hypothetical protein UX70_C0001G0157 [Candidatus Wolfebacteria bacterium GW2011_GWB1_47_1]